MGEKRTGGIVLAVTLAIGAAFAAIMLLFLSQTVNITARYAERTTDLVSSDVSWSLVALMGDQSALAASNLLDDELCEALEAEGPAGANDAPKAAKSLAPVLDLLEVDDTGSLTYVISTNTYTIYRSDGTWEDLSANADDVAWINALCNPHRGELANTYRARFRQSDGRPQTRVLSGRPLLSGKGVVGVVGVSVPGALLGDAMLQVMGEKNGELEAVCFTPEGGVLFSTNEDVAANSDVFSLYPEVSSARDELPKKSQESVEIWDGLEGLLPRGQRLFSIRYFEDFGSYLLIANTAHAEFESMRTRSTTLMLALSVVMVLLMLLVITNVRWYRTRLMEIATTDELTGLANRKSFVSRYETYAQRGAEPATLALIDVDFFKRVNDTYGHAAGDHALAAVAAEVRTLAGSRGIAGRWGGDEFIAVVDATGEEALERIQTMIANVRHAKFEEGFSVSVSMGSTIIDWTSPLERMVEQADDALYQTKGGGRGFHTPYVAGVTPHVSGSHIPLAQGCAAPASSGEPEVLLENVSVAAPSAADSGARRFMDLTVESLLEAVRKMIPFVAGGGILIAVAFLIDGASVDVNSLSAEARANFGSITPLAAGLKDVGSAAFNFMLPIFAAFFARGLAGGEAFMAGFAGGYLSSQGSAGFAGAILASLVSAAVVRMMRGFVDETPKAVQRIAPVLLYPVFSLLIMYLLMTFVIDPVASAFDAALTSMLVSLGHGSRILLGMVCGAMMATDMGGPINKASYHFGVASIAAGAPDVMAAVMVGGMVPPCGIALCMLLFGDRFHQPERDQAAATFVMGLSFITEGAIPFVLTDPLRVIPACMVGSGVAGALSVIFECTLMAPHGGIFVFPVVGNSLMYLAALAVGSLETALLLGLLKSRRTKD